MTRKWFCDKNSLKWPADTGRPFNVAVSAKEHGVQRRAELAILATVQERNRNRDLSLRLDHEYHTSVRLCAASITPGARDHEPCLSVADGFHELVRDPLCDEKALHCLSAPARELEIVLRPARGIGESLDGDERTLIVALRYLSKATECRVVAIAHGSLIEIEVYREGELHPESIAAILAPNSVRKLCRSVLSAWSSVRSDC